MKKILFLLCLTIVIASKNVNAQSKEHLDAARKDMANARADLKQAQKDSVAEYQLFKKESEEKIANNQKEIIELRAKRISKVNEANNDYNKKMLDLEEKNTKLKSRITNYKADGSTNWVIFKRQFNEEMDIIQKSFMDSRD